MLKIFVCASVFFVLTLRYSEAIDCYNLQGSMTKATIKSGCQFCSALFWKDGDGTFRGSRHNLTEEKTIDCKPDQLMYDGAQEANGYYCYCSTNLCNEPITWEEFQKRGYTLTPLADQKKNN